MRIGMIGLKGLPTTYGGVERHVEELGACLVELGHEVTACARSHYTPAGTETHRGIRIVRQGSIRTKHLDAISHTLIASLHALGRDFDVIHYHAIGPALLSMLPRLWPPCRAAVVATVHSLDWRRRKWGAFARWCLRRGEWAATRFPHRTIVVSPLLRDHYSERGKDVTYVPNGVPAAAPLPLDRLRRFHVEPGGYFLWMGRFVPEKRVEDLIRAFRALPGEVRLLLAGELDESGGYARRLREEAGADERIVFAGGLYDEDKREALTNAAAVVLPSDLEGFPIVLLEAMRYGRPVLVSDIPEHLHVVADEANGVTFPMGNTGALTERMQWVLSHPDEAQEVGRKAEETAAEYDWARIAKETEGVYREALEATGS